MQTHKILISVPNNLAHRLRCVIPTRQRSKVISGLIEQEIEKREQGLYACALEIENDESLNREMQDWDTTIADGLGDLANESW